MLDKSLSSTAQPPTVGPEFGKHARLFLVPDGPRGSTYVDTVSASAELACSIHALPWYSGHDDQLITLEAMAARLVSMVRAIQPVGPYRIAGFSLGGVLAYAMTHRLLSLDEAVAFLGLIDVEAPTTKLSDEPSISYHVHDLVARHTLRNQVEHATPFVRQGFTSLVGSHTVAEHVVGRTLHAQEAFHRAVINYEVPNLPIVVHLFQPVGERQMRDRQELSSVAALERRPPSSSLRLVPIRKRQDPTGRDAAWDADLGVRLGEALREPVTARIGSLLHSPLMPLHLSRNRAAPLICIPGAGASVTSFVELIEAYGDHSDLHGLQPRGVCGSDVPHGSIAAEVVCNLRAIERLSSAGPVHLLGHSHGGVVAFEMARRLVDEGRRVSSLTLIDSSLPDAGSDDIKDVENEEILREFVRSFELFFERTLSIDSRVFAVGKFEPLIRALHKALVEQKCIPATSKPAMLRGPLSVFAAAQRSSYTPALYAGKVLLILARDPSLDAVGDEEERLRIASAWAAHVPHLVVWFGPGNHFSILRAPHVHVVVHKWRETFEERC